MLSAFKTILLIILIIVTSLDATAQTDSIKTYFDRSSGFKVYTYDNGTSQLPLTGSNDMYSLIGSKFLFSGTAELKGILVAFAEKKKIVNNVHQIIAYHLDDQGKMPSGAAIGVGNFYLDDISVDKDKPVFTWLPFNVKKAFVSKSFGAMVMTRTAINNDDYISIFSNLQGDGQGMRTSFDLWADQNNNFHYEDLWDFPVETDADGNPDIDVMIVPVMDFSSNINNNASFGGLKVVSESYNLSSSNFCLRLYSESSSTLNISLYDYNGRLLERIDKSIISDAEELFLFDMKSHSPGAYFYVIQSEKTRFSGSFLKIGN